MLRPRIRLCACVCVCVFSVFNSTKHENKRNWKIKKNKKSNNKCTKVNAQYENIPNAVHNTHRSTYSNHKMYNTTHASHRVVDHSTYFAPSNLKIWKFIHSIFELNGSHCCVHTFTCKYYTRQRHRVHCVML